MNSAPDNRNEELDRLLDESLNKLPEREAPESMLTNIMARIAEEEESARLSWFARLRWPTVAVSAFSVFLVTYFSQEIFQSFLNFVNAGQFAGGIKDVNLGLSILSTLGSALVKVFNLIPGPVLYSLAGVLFFFSALSCAGVGTVLVRLTRSGDSMTTHNAI